MENFAKFIVLNRWKLITLVFVLTAIFGYSAKDMKTDNSIEIWLKQNDPSLTFYNKFKNDFGNEEFLIISIDSKTIFTPDGIKLISKTSSQLKKLNGIKDVTSLATTFKEKLNQPYFKKLLSQNKNGSKQTTLEMFKNEILNDKLYVNNLISKNGNTTAIIALVDNVSKVTENKKAREENLTEFRRDLVKEVRKIITANFSSIATPLIHTTEPNTDKQSFLDKIPFLNTPVQLPESTHLAGPSAVNAELDRMSQKDLALFIPLMFCVSLIVLIILFRKAAAILLPISIIALCNVWTMGTFALAGNSMNMISGIITPVIFIITLANSIHIINYHYINLSKNPTKPNLVINTIKNIGTPCFFTCVTTAIGFASLMASDVAPVRITGAFTSIGIMFSFFISTVLIISIFSFFSQKTANPKKRASDDKITNSILDKITNLVSKYPWRVITITIIVVGISTCGMFKLKVESDLLKMFPNDSEILISNNHIEQHLTGLLPLEVVIRTTAENESILKASTLKQIEEFQKSLENINEITHTLSIVDFIKNVNYYLNSKSSNTFNIPEKEETSFNYLKMASSYGNKYVESFYTKDQKSCRLSIRMKQVGSERYAQIVNIIKNHINNNFTNNSNVKLTGVIHLLIEMQDYLIFSQIKTLSLAFAIIFIVMIFLLRSIKLALISMIPNILPIIITFGVMGFSGIRVDSGTVMIASIAIGIAVDDTIHFLYRFKKTHNNDFKNSIEQTIKHVGKSIMFTSIVAFCGFMVLYLSSFKPIQYFGLLTAITMITAFIADIFVLPCCLLILKPTLKRNQE